MEDNSAYEVIHVMDADTYDALLALATVLQRNNDYCSRKLDLLLTRIVECTVARGTIQFSKGE